jgi:DNA-binding HxlR family transcriptional regulator
MDKVKQMRLIGKKTPAINIAPSEIGDSIPDKAYIRRVSLSCEILLQGKWRVHILCAMRSGPVRLGRLARLIPHASKKMLAQNLRSLEGAGIVIRRDLSDVLLHVEYDLEPGLRQSICSLLNELSKWGSLYSLSAVEGRTPPQNGLVESASKGILNRN